MFNKNRLSILLGGLFMVLAVVMFVHDGEFLLTGRTVDLNAVLQNGDPPPRDRYVTYTCDMSLGSYGWTQPKYGFIPLPGKTQEYALLDESGLIFSAKIGKRSKINEMESLTDETGGPVTITGCLQTISGDMSRYLAEYMNEVDLEANGLALSYYEINTAMTRLSQILLYLGLFLLGLIVALPVNVLAALIPDSVKQRLARSGGGKKEESS